MFKAVLFDLDGIVIVGRKQLFSHTLAEQQGVPRKEVEEFFLGNFKKCSFGKADLKVEIAPYLAKWKWQGSTEDLLKFWFESDSTTNKEVLKIISDLRSRGIGCYIATRQEKYRLQYLLETVRLKDHFDGVFCTCNIGYDKKEPQFFNHVFQKLNLKPEEILFFDDNQTNIANATSLGVQAYLYDDINILRKHTNNLS